MTAVVTRPLPHKVGNAAIASGELKTVVMQFMENFLSVGGQLSAVQEAVRELQRRKASGGSGIADIETYVGRAETAATTATAARTAAVAARDTAVSAANAALAQRETADAAAETALARAEAASAAAEGASSSATAAGESASAASQSAANAESSATEAQTAKTQAEAARDAAFAASAVVLNFRNMDLGASVPRSTFTLADFVADTGRDYSVSVRFTNEAAYARSCKVDEETVSLANSVGATAETTVSVAGTGSFTVDNIAATVQVSIRIS